MQIDVNNMDKKSVIENLLISKESDVVFIENLKIEDKYLPYENRLKYIEGLKYLYLLERFSLNHAKYHGFSSKKEFNDFVLDLIKTNSVSLPRTYNKLIEKVRAYKTKGALVIVSKHFGNQKTRKVKDAVQEALIMELLRVHMNWDSVRICNKYNIVAKSKGWQEISESTIRRYKKIGDFKLAHIAGTRGQRVFLNKVGMNNKRRKPKFALQYVTLDGWDVELLYRKQSVNRKGHKVTSYDNRQVIVIVLDAFNEYIIGYSIGERESSALITEALKNAVIHSKELFGAYYRPHEIQSDNFAKKAMKPIYTSLAAKHYVPAAVGNAKSKIIEPYFKKINVKYCQTQYNWSGFNIDSRRENQPNREYLSKIKKEMPDLEENTLQIVAIIEAERSAKRDKYISSWLSMEECDKKEISREEFLKIFGDTTGYTNKLNANGIIVTIAGYQYCFDTFDLSFRGLSHLDWTVKYDINDLSNIVVESEGGKYRYLLEEKKDVAMSLSDAEQADFEYRKKVNDFNKALSKKVVDRLEKNVEELNKHSIDTRLKLMIPDSKGQIKERIQDVRKLDYASDFDILDMV